MPKSWKTPVAPLIADSCQSVRPYADVATEPVDASLVQPTIMTILNNDSEKINRFCNFINALDTDDFIDALDKLPPDQSSTLVKHSSPIIQKLLNRYASQ